MVNIARGTDADNISGGRGRGGGGGGGVEEGGGGVKHHGAWEDVVSKTN